jgi:hypothetical protein
MYTGRSCRRLSSGVAVINPSETGVDKEADVIADTDVVSAPIGRASQRPTVLGSGPSERKEYANPNGTHAS